MNAKDDRKRENTMYQSALDEEFTDEQLRVLEARWKSDVDKKLDALAEFHKRYEAFLDLLVEREKASARLRAAIIEKTVAGLIWAGIVAVAAMAISGLRSETKAFLEAMDNLRPK